MGALVAGRTVPVPVRACLYKAFRMHFGNSTRTYLRNPQLFVVELARGGFLFNFGDFCSVFHSLTVHSNDIVDLMGLFLFEHSQYLHAVRFADTCAQKSDKKTGSLCEERTGVGQSASLFHISIDILVANRVPIPKQYEVDCLFASSTSASMLIRHWHTGGLR